MAEVTIQTKGTLVTHHGFAYIYVESKVEVDDRNLDAHLHGEYNNRVDSWSKRGITANKSYRELVLSKRTKEIAMPLTHKDTKKLLKEAKQIARELTELARKTTIPVIDYSEFAKTVKETVRIEETIEI